MSDNQNRNPGGGFTRRDALLGGLFGAGWIGLRALATGVPASFLLRPSDALAEDLCDKAVAQYLVISMSSQGDPVNSNAPGCYLIPDIIHPADPAMAPTMISLGGRMYQAAKPWSTLPQWALDRTCFFHHATLTNNHPNLPKVMRLMGATAKSEMMPSIFAKSLAQCLGTVQTEPVSVGAGEVLTFEGRGLPDLKPTGLRDVLTHPAGPLTRLQKVRDASLDKMHALLKTNGTAVQRAYLDRMAQSRIDARSISQNLLDNLSSIVSDNDDGQVVAAATLIKMNVAPVIAVGIRFGGDNHTDTDLAAETAQTQTGVARIGLLLQKLQEYGLQDQVTFAMTNVFGRTLKKLGTKGRDHWASHHVSVMIGKPIKAGVIGGLEPRSGDYGATAIDSKTGMSGGDVPFESTLAALGRTLGAGLGVPASVLDANIAQSKVIAAALV